MTTASPSEIKPCRCGSVDITPSNVRARRWECRKCKATRSARWRKENTARHDAMLRRCHLKREYGLTEAQYAERVAMQGGVCAICCETCSSGQRLAVDHSHETGAVRGLLCHGCNLSLGRLKESPAILTRALRYLHAHGKALTTEDVAALLGIIDQSAEAPT